jgi:hypothetical protein
MVGKLIGCGPTKFCQKPPDKQEISGDKTNGKQTRLEQKHNDPRWHDSGEGARELPLKLAASEPQAARGSDRVSCVYNSDPVLPLSIRIEHD